MDSVTCNKVEGAYGRESWLLTAEILWNFRTKAVWNSRYQV